MPDDKTTGRTSSPTDQLALLIDSVFDYAIFMLSPEGEIRTWNEGARRTFGYERDEIIGKSFSTFYGEDDLKLNKPKRELEVAAETGRIEDLGWRIRKDGTRFWVNTVITALRAPDGPLLGFTKVTRDLTERKRAEESARQAAEIFQLLVSSVRDYAIFMLDPEGYITTWNPGAERIKGYKPEEIIGRHFSVFYPEEDKDKPARELAIARAEGSVEDEGWRLRKDGTRFWANVVITAVYGPAGDLRGFAKVTRDLTERREALEQLRQSTEIFQLLVSSVRDYAIFMLDPEGNIATWNAGAQRIKGYKPEEIIGRHFSVFYPEEDKDKPARELAIARAEGSVEDEGWRVRKDGTRFWANVVITAVFDRSGTLRGFAKVTRDITDRKQAEETQRALLEQREARLLAEEERRRAEASYHAAQEANRAKDEFLMTLSHELRTPMTAILGWARLLPTMSPSDPIFGEAVSAISAGAQVQARLIDDILDVSRVVSGKLRLSPETLDVGRLIQRGIDSVKTTADAKDITIRTSLAPDLGQMVGDSTRLQQVLWNLLSNAVKFTPRKGSVHVSAIRTASRIEINVRDTGEGIDAQFLPHVFEPFRQAEAPQTRIHGGLGLGLSIVRYIAEAHGGSVSAESAGRGKGASFTVSLPVRAVASGDIPVRNAMGETFRHGDRLRGLRVVVVDDDRESRRMVSAVLSASGATVDAFESAGAALEAIDQQRPDLIITDIAMPEIDGYAFIRALRQREGGPGIKVVALTAFPSAMEEKNDFAAYLVKPIDPFHLIDAIAQVALRASA